MEFFFNFFFLLPTAFTFWKRVLVMWTIFWQSWQISWRYSKEKICAFLRLKLKPILKHWYQIINLRGHLSIFLLVSFQSIIYLWEISSPLVCIPLYFVIFLYVREAIIVITNFIVGDTKYFECVIALKMLSSTAIDNMMADFLEHYGPSTLKSNVN